MRLRHTALLVFVAILWGVNFTVIKIGLKGMPPLAFSALRFLMVAFPAILFVRRPGAPLRDVAIYGLVMFAGQFAFLFSAMHVGLSAGLASLVLQIQAFFTMIMSAFFLREKPRLFQIFGACIAAAGIGVVGLHTGGDVTPAGLGLVLIAALGFAAGNILARRLGKVDMLGVVVWGGLFAFPVLAGMSLALEGWDKVAGALLAARAETFLALAYIVYLSTFLAFTAWNRMLALYPAAMVAPFTLLVPVFGMASAALLLHEAYPGWKLAATLLIVAGLAVNQFGGKLGALFGLLRRRIRMVHGS